MRDSARPAGMHESEDDGGRMDRTPGREGDRNRRETGSAMRRFCIRLTITASIAAALVAALAMGGCNSGGGATGSTTGSTGSTTIRPDQGNTTMDKLYQQVRKDFDAIKAGKQAEVWADSAAELKASKTAEDFKNMVVAQSAYMEWTKFTIKGQETHTAGRPGTEGARVSMTVELREDAEPPYDIDVVYIFQGGQWKLASILPSAAQQQG